VAALHDVKEKCSLHEERRKGINAIVVFFDFM